ncbi:hypothetical protein [Thermoleptolyngbya sp.]
MYWCIGYGVLVYEGIQCIAYRLLRQCRSLWPQSVTAFCQRFTTGDRPTDAPL